MSKFKCKKCDAGLELDKYRIKFVDGKVVSDDAMCCEQHMESIRDTSQGFGGIIKKPNGTVSGKF
tara:strand:+ start:782 stop:976 length:195 start_codon:yes stop_codon:yes gene_type:complete